jgi:hypothetical protein
MTSSPARTPPGSPSCSPRPSSLPGHRSAGALLAADYVVFVIIELSP